MQKSGDTLWVWSIVKYSSLTARGCSNTPASIWPAERGRRRERVSIRIRSTYLHPPTKKVGGDDWQMYNVISKDIRVTLARIRKLSAILLTLILSLTFPSSLWMAGQWICGSCVHHKWMHCWINYNRYGGLILGMCGDGYQHLVPFVLLWAPLFLPLCWGHGIFIRPTTPSRRFCTGGGTLLLTISLNKLSVVQPSACSWWELLGLCKLHYKEYGLDLLYM